ncbi:MAG TPA: hypothetical protein VK463_08620 [Desulfomonilaceae bacterium]|nr:hypothetical protein [Desulfomonilaceae bacterium]
MEESMNDVQSTSESKPQATCHRCGSAISRGDERDYYGRSLCEDCYMDALSPVRTCDPWAVHSAKQLGDKTGGLHVNPLQEGILKILRETGGIEPGDLAVRLCLKPLELEREIAALRHMEKLRGELRNGRKYVVLW